MNFRRVDVDVHQQAGEVVEGNVLQDAVQHALDGEAEEARPVEAAVNTELFDLDDAFFLGIVHLGFNVGEARHVKVQDLH